MTRALRSMGFIGIALMLGAFIAVQTAAAKEGDFETAIYHLLYEGTAYCNPECTPANWVLMPDGLSQEEQEIFNVMAGNQEVRSWLYQSFFGASRMTDYKGSVDNQQTQKTIEYFQDRDVWHYYYGNLHRGSW